jgi:hypothetical protein
MPHPLAPCLRALASLTLVLAVLGGCGAGGSGGSAAAAGDPTGVRARQARAFVDSLGINTHTYYSDTVYHQRFATVERRLRELGVSHIRENLVPHRPDQYRALNRLAAAGIDSQLILGDPGNGRAGLRRLVAILATRLDGAVSAVEGPNEYDLSGDPRWRGRLDRYQRYLYRTVRATPELKRLPIVGPSVGQLRDELKVTDLSRYLDFGNVHSYPDGDPPEWILGLWLRAAVRTSGGKPVMATETGYHNALRTREGQRPVSERAMAVYAPRTYLDYFARGVVRTFPYELLDEFPDPGNDEPESNFGLLRNDLSPKPAFRAVANLAALLRDPGPAFAPGRLDFTLGGDTGQLRTLLLQKRDGRFYLALWSETSVWDPNRREPRSPSSAPVQVTFVSQPDRVSARWPNRGRNAGERLALSAGPTSIEVGPRVVILEIDPAG